MWMVVRDCVEVGGEDGGEDSSHDGGEYSGNDGEMDCGVEGGGIEPSLKYCYMINI